jgi:hypothetical protein
MYELQKVIQLLFESEYNYAYLTERGCSGTGPCTFQRVSKYPGICLVPKKALRLELGLPVPELSTFRIKDEHVNADPTNKLI